MLQQAYAVSTSTSGTNTEAVGPVTVPGTAPQAVPKSSPPPKASSPSTSPAIESPDSAQKKLEASKVPLNVAFAGLALYSLIGLITLVAMIFPPQKSSPTRQSQIVQRLFSVLVIVFCLLRLVYFCFPIAHVSVIVTYIVNQAAFMVFFTMFSLIIFFWAEQYHRKFYDTQSMLPRLRNVFIVVNIVLWSLEILLVVLAVTLGQVPTDKLVDDPTPAAPAPESPSTIVPLLTLAGTPRRSLWQRMWEREASESMAGTVPMPLLTPSTNTKGAGLGGPLYFASVISIIIVDFIFSMGFATYGIAIFIQKYRFSLGRGLRRELVATMIVTFVFAACFALRMVMFLYRPITGKFLNGTLYRVLAYFVPEVSAVLLQISVVYLMHHGTSRTAGWKRSARSTVGGFDDANERDSMQRPGIDDDVYYYAAEQDLRSSSMPAPRENAHERLISPPRPLRNNFGTSATAASHSASSSIQSNSTAPAALNSAVAGISAALAAGPLNSSTSSSSLNATPTATSPDVGKYSSPNVHGHMRSSSGAYSSGLPHALATHQSTRIISPIISPIGSPPSSYSTSFSPGHDQPLMSTVALPSELPLSNVHIGNTIDNRGTEDSESDYEYSSDSASLLPNRRAR